MADRILVGSKDVNISVGNGETVEEIDQHGHVAGIDRKPPKNGANRKSG